MLTPCAALIYKGKHKMEIKRVAANMLVNLCIYSLLHEGGPWIKALPEAPFDKKLPATNLKP